MMMMIKSTELVLIEIMSIMFCYPCNSTRDALHSEMGSTKCTLSQIVEFKLNIFVFMCEKGP
jgi:hypothetical protein